MPDAKAIPLEVYDIAADTRWVGVGTGHDNAVFAIASIRRWWHACGQGDVPPAHRLMITANVEGSDAYRIRA